MYTQNLVSGIQAYRFLMMCYREKGPAQNWGSAARCSKANTQETTIGGKGEVALLRKREPEKMED